MDSVKSIFTWLTKSQLMQLELTVYFHRYWFHEYSDRRRIRRSMIAQFDNTVEVTENLPTVNSFDGAAVGHWVLLRSNRQSKFGLSTEGLTNVYTVQCK